MESTGSKIHQIAVYLLRSTKITYHSGKPFHSVIHEYVTFKIHFTEQENVYDFIT